MSPEFDRYAETYSSLLHDPIRERFAPGSGFFAERKRLLLRSFFARRGVETGTLSWLDHGCGQGDLLRLAGGSFARASGCDLSPAMLEACADLDVRRQTSTVAIPFDDESFDLVTAVCVYHHIEPAERPAVTAEVRRVLKPGGIFCIMEHNPFNPATQLIVSRTPVDADAKLLRSGTARKLMRQARIEPVETRFFLYFPERWYARFARWEDRFARLPFGGQYAVLGVK